MLHFNKLLALNSSSLPKKFKLVALDLFPTTNAPIYFFPPKCNYKKPADDGHFGKKKNRRESSASLIVTTILCGNHFANMEDDPKVIESGLFADLKLQGAILLTSFLDQFEYYPFEGMGSGLTLEEQSEINMHEKSIPTSDRLKVFKIKYGNDTYDARLFTRVAAGKKF